MDNEVLKFYKNKKVLVTGHTGFKGSWLCEMLILAGAEVSGYALSPNTENSIYDIINLKDRMKSYIGDIRDLTKLKEVFSEVKPEIVFHLAAQPIVRESYKDPVYTYETNVMGTVNILECIRKNESVKSFLNVTTDKVYKNKEWEWGYRENEELDGYDPYSNSKSCSELVTHSYKSSFFGEKNISVSTARAGNVIGGGDFSVDRIIPDCIRYVQKGEEIIVRNPYSTRPYQHVLEPLYAYLLIGKSQYENKTLEDCYNVGPDEIDCFSTGKLVDLFCEKWFNITGNKVTWVNKSDGGPHEANFLKLDCSKIKSKLNWKSNWNVDKAMEMIIKWTIAHHNSEDMIQVTDNQIKEFVKATE